MGICCGTSSSLSPASAGALPKGPLGWQLLSPLPVPPLSPPPWTRTPHSHAFLLSAKTSTAIISQCPRRIKTPRTVRWREPQTLRSTGCFASSCTASVSLGGGRTAGCRSWFSDTDHCQQGLCGPESKGAPRRPLPLPWAVVGPLHWGGTSRHFPTDSCLSHLPAETWVTLGAAELMEKLVGTVVGIWPASQKAQGRGRDDQAQGPVIPEKHGNSGCGMWRHRREVRDLASSPQCSRLAVWPWQRHSAPQFLCTLPSTPPTPGHWSARAGADSFTVFSPSCRMRGFSTNGSRQEPVGQPAEAARSLDMEDKTVCSFCRGIKRCRESFKGACHGQIRNEDGPVAYVKRDQKM